MPLYKEDQRLLKKYNDRDSVVDSGNVYNVQAEVVKICESRDRIILLVTRLLDRGIVLTRINTHIRDTSVLFRLLCFGGLKKTLNLNTKERKRFEVYACAMAERNYTLEIWRLLDPEAHLIDHKQLYISSYCIRLLRQVYIEAFAQGLPRSKVPSREVKVIDDRLKVWEDVDQP
ncbi:hypothetical protein DCAR_0104186 [Daucus carota subsp. sativus]|uniref:protein-serine/threonine phosphatase n=1 Tax=Daucus carota subsp. sativus TaxID=79200 RepID=A0A166IM73_DAUCS|nr:hypothetical protein DCAR_0104186 [Daucus carota subsp. sativus]